MMKGVEIIDCTAVHDEISTNRNPNHAFSFCPLNAICSHGNKIVEDALEAGVTTGKISASQAEIFLRIWQNTEIYLSQGVDRVAHAMKIIRERNLEGFETKDFDVIERSLVSELGPDKTSWRKILKKRQLAIAAPKIAIVRRLESLGLLTCGEGIRHIDTEKVAKTGDPRNRTTV